MRVLVFEGNEQGATRFQFLYTGLLRGTPQGGLRGLEQMRRAAKILEKLEAVSEVVRHPADQNRVLYYGDTGDVVRQLIESGGQVELADEEFDMLRSHFENAPQTAGAAKAYVDTADFLSTSPTRNDG